MKKVMFLMMSFLILLAGCSKDDPFSVPGEKVWKKVPVTKSMTVTLLSIPDLSKPHVECLPENSHVFLSGGGSFQGNVSEIGNVVTNESQWRVNSCETGSGKGQLKESISGRITGVSGDYCTYSGTIIIDFFNNTLMGTLYIEGGSGKFYMSSGVVEIEGQVNVSSSTCSWTGTGSITLRM